MAIGIRYFGQGTRPMTGSPRNFNPNDPLGVLGGSGATVETEGGGDTTSAAAMKAKLERDKFDAEQAAAEKSLERTRRGTEESMKYLRGLLDLSGRPFGGLEEQIAQQETSGRQYIEDQARMLADLISGRRTQAMQTTTAGYDALRNYLAANPMQAFAQTQRAVPTVQQGILEQYLASRGISAAPAQAGQDVVNAQLAAQAANYNQLLNVLTGAEAQQQSSRAAEEQMARALAGTQLEALYGAQTSGLEQQRLAALNDLASRVAAARLEAEQARIAREQALQNEIAKLLGAGFVQAPPVGPSSGTPPGNTPPGNTPPGNTPPVAPVAPVRPIDALAARAVQAEAAGNDRLANRISDFIEANPNAGIIKIEREFPQIAQSIRNTQVPTPYSAPATNFPLMGFE